MNQQDPYAVSKVRDEKLCGSCGATIKIKAEICPQCGVRQRSNISKAVLLLLTFFFGGLGAHKFYTGKNWQGVFYILFCWTGIPGLIALIEFIIYACTSSDDLQEKYSASGGGVVAVAIIVGFFTITAIIGILAAIAIPQFVQFRHRAVQKSITLDLENLLAAEQNYFSEYNIYSTSLDSLNFTPSPGVNIEIISADEYCFEAVATHDHLSETMSVDCQGLAQE